MKAFILKSLDRFLTKVAKNLVLTNCTWFCNRGDTPEELLK